MAGAGYKLFNTGDVLTAAQVNTYLQEQAVMVFADATARTTALSGVLAEGMITYLKSDDKVYKYTGAAWVEVGGGSSPLTTKGDLYTYSTTDARLGVGTNGQVLTANSSTSTGLEWTTISAGGMTLLSTTNLTTATTSITGISQSYTNLMITIAGISIPTAQRLQIEFRNSTSARVCYVTGTNQTAVTTRNGVTSFDVFDTNLTATDTRNMVMAYVDNYSSSTRRKGLRVYGATNDGGSYVNLAGSIETTGTIDAFYVNLTATPTAGTVQIWGIK